MRKLGWISLPVTPLASRGPLLLSLNLFFVFLLLICIGQASASLAEAANVPTRKHSKPHNLNDYYDKGDKEILHSRKGAGRSSSFHHPYAYSSPYQKNDGRPSDAPDLSTIINERANLPNPSFDKSFSNPRSIGDWTVADFILVSSIDGSLHARDRHTGLELWEIPGDKPLVQVSTSEALQNRTKFHFSSSKEPCEDCDVIWIVEPLGEGILYYFTPLTGLQQLPITIKELVMQSPFSLRGDDKIYIGSRSTTLYSIESSTGKILKAYGAGKSSLSQAACRTQRNPFVQENDDDSDLLDDDDFDIDLSEENGSFMIGRTGMFLHWDDQFCTNSYRLHA